VSYCRFLEADAYIFEHVGGFWQCCDCALSTEEWGSADFNTREELLAHIDKHRQAGHYIPDNVDKRLHEEIRTQ
jgi:hypothetical protein